MITTAGRLLLRPPDAPTALTERRWRRSAGYLTAATQTDRGTWLVTAATFLYGFALTARWPQAYRGANMDAIAAAWPAYTVVRSGSFDLSTVDGLPPVLWFRAVGSAVFSDRSPGVILIGAPAQLLARPFGADPLTPAVLTAVLVTAAALANAAVLLRRTVGPRPLVFGAVSVLGLGTALWTTAADELWTHGPDALWLTLALLALQRQQHLLAGGWAALAVSTRPHLALAVAVIGLVLAREQRSVRVLWQLGVPSAVALVGLVLWTHAQFGQWTLAAGLPLSNPDVSGTSAGAWWRIAEGVAGTLASPLRGVLLYSPVVAVLLVALVRGWDQVPAWARGAAYGGALYLLAQLKLNTFTGGSGFFGNRLVLETFVLATPAAVVALTAPANARLLHGWPLRVTAALSVAVHAVGSVLVTNGEPLYRLPGEASTADGRNWLLLTMVDRYGSVGWTVAAVAVAGSVAAFLLLPRRVSAGSPS